MNYTTTVHQGHRQTDRRLRIPISRFALRACIAR